MHTNGITLLNDNYFIASHKLNYVTVLTITFDCLSSLPALALKIPLDVWYTY